MSILSTALNTALSGLTSSSIQSAIVSRNVASVNDPDYSRRTAAIITLPGGAVSVASYDRSADKRMLDKLLDATSLSAGNDAVLSALSQLTGTIGDPQSENSITSLLGKFQDALRNYEANPADNSLAANAIQSAKSLTRALNAASQAVQDTRKTADQAMQTSVASINALLGQFKVANDAVIRGGGTPGELADSLDQRDRILKQLSEEIGIRTVTRANNDVAIYTDSGIPLFETTPRQVTLAATNTFTAGQSGNPVMVDGVRLSGAAAPMAGTTGRLASLAQVRDGIAVTYQSQLDEVARGLISEFAEHDQSASPSLPDVAGLFDMGSTTIPTQGTAGVASAIRVNPLADPERGGNPSLLRDGGFGGAAYVQNTTHAEGYQARLGQLIDGLNQPISFDASAQLGTSATLADFSAGASGWLEGKRAQVSSQADATTAEKFRASDALRRVTGVNIDEEMTTMLDLEKAYQASAKVISAVDGMLQTLLQTIGQ